MCRLTSVWHETERQKGLRVTTRTIHFFFHNTAPLCKANVSSSISCDHSLFAHLHHPSQALWGSTANCNIGSFNCRYLEAPVGPKVFSYKKEPRFLAAPLAVDLCCGAQAWHLPCITKWKEHFLFVSSH